MIIQEGQYVFDGKNYLVVCAIKEYSNSLYAYLINENNDEVGFYEVIIKDDDCNFKLVKDEKLIQELILFFAKDYAEKNPDVLKEIETFNNFKKQNELQENDI